MSFTDAIVKHETNNIVVAEEILSVPVRSLRQPEQIGFPFTIFAPVSVVETNRVQIKALIDIHRLKAKEEQPKFMRTGIPMVRLSVRYGDARTASHLYQLLKDSRSPLVFKNWL